MELDELTIVVFIFIIVLVFADCKKPTEQETNYHSCPTCFDMGCEPKKFMTFTNELFFSKDDIARLNWCTDKACYELNREEVEMMGLKFVENKSKTDQAEPGGRWGAKDP